MALYQNTSNYGPGVEISPMLLVLGFHIKIKRKFLKIFLCQTVRARAFMFGVQHHLVAFYQNTSNYGPGVENSPMLWVLVFHIEIKKDIFKKSSCPKPQGLELSYLACSIIYWSSTKILQIMALEWKIVLCCWFSDFT